jgi:hypothetical protein
MLVVLAVALTAAWGASWAGAAAKHHFMVTYAGTGHYSAKTETQVACGIESRDETTEFSWIANYPLTLSFGRHGFQTVNQTVQPDPAPQSVDNSNSASVSFSGCAGTASCRGRSEPAQGSLAALKVPAAGPGRPEQVPGRWGRLGGLQAGRFQRRLERWRSRQLCQLGPPGRDPHHSGVRHHRGDTGHVPGEVRHAEEPARAPLLQGPHRPRALRPAQARVLPAKRRLRV